MLHHDYEHMCIQASDRRRVLEQEAIAYHAAHPSQDSAAASNDQSSGLPQQGLPQQALSKLGDVLIASGTRLKSASAPSAASPSAASRQTAL